MCAKDDLRAPGVDDVELNSAADSVGERRTRRRKKSAAKDTAQVVKEEPEHEKLVSLEASPDTDAEGKEQTVPPLAPIDEDDADPSQYRASPSISQYYLQPYACLKETSRRPFNTGT